ncbi:hypothetical protein [Thermoclostridium caenicola]|uniref:PDZ domain-containing protein n=1 Tax=Thermoclostridium caenicola TaxID=659425 RepID=A0A1M6KK12_9FIRM|nr:hypothetical protein [Thermoclostridium caenicola]SHJ59317.1 hypothetical protein SAMN05444373_10832 [Thermoclostridium caenicola]
MAKISFKRKRSIRTAAVLVCIMALGTALASCSRITVGVEQKVHTKKAKPEISSNAVQFKDQAFEKAVRKYFGRNQVLRSDLSHITIIEITGETLAADGVNKDDMIKINDQEYRNIGEIKTFRIWYSSPNWRAYASAISP